MAKKVIQQLDLFANLLETVTEAPKATPKPIVPTTAEEKNIVYANDNIVVKVKNDKATKQPNKEVIKPTSTKLISTTSIGKRGRKSFKEMDDELSTVNIPDDETLKQKLYYPIREVAAFFNVNTSLIRMWETEFDILQPRKNRKGDRLFRFEDIKNLQIIYYLLRNKKFSLDGAKKYLKENKGKLDSNQQLLLSLKKIKNFLIEIKSG